VLAQSSSEKRTGLILAGDVIVWRLLALGPVRWRTCGAVLALATAAAGVAAGLDLQLILVAAVLIGPLLAERGPGPGRPGSGPAGGELVRPDAAG
jgi:hypothetical protein